MVRIHGSQLSCCVGVPRVPHRGDSRFGKYIALALYTYSPYGPRVCLSICLMHERLTYIIPQPLSLLSEVFELVLRDLTGGDWRSRQKLSEAFDRHNAHIRAIVPKENLLEWEPSHGWEPLCNFLGKPVPDDPFPHSNQGDDVARGLLMYARLRIAKWTLRKASWPMASMMLAGASWLLWKRSLVFA